MQTLGYHGKICLKYVINNNTIRVSNSLDPDQARFFGRLDLGSNCYQQTTKTSRVKVWCSAISATDISA